MFQEVNKAVKAMLDCCGEGKPMAKSEVLNETWLLRMVLALIHDNDPERIGVEKVETTLELIKAAIDSRWISEGGLEPAFELEGTTWTDAILGGVRINDKNKRGIDIVSNLDVGVVVIEAKMGSALASGVSHSKHYNQAARNIACLAKLVMKASDDKFLNNSAFVVLAPACKLKEWEDGRKGAQTLINKAWEVIDAENRHRIWGDESRFKDVVNRIVKKSAAISWENVIESFKCDEALQLKSFYEAVCEEYDIPTQFSNI